MAHKMKGCWRCNTNKDQDRAHESTEMVWRRLEQVSRWWYKGWIVVVVALDNEIGSHSCDGDAASDGG